MGGLVSQLTTAQFSKGGENMVVRFYKNKSDNRYVDKDIELITTLNNVVFKSDENQETLTLELSYNSDILNHANYCYIVDLEHYYYMSEPTFGKQRVFYPLKADLLMTFKTQILNLDCIIARQENEYNTYINDERLPVENKQQINTLYFPDGFSYTNTGLLIVNGQG